MGPRLLPGVLGHQVVAASHQGGGFRACRRVGGAVQDVVAGAAVAEPGGEGGGVAGVVGGQAVEEGVQDRPDGLLVAGLVQDAGECAETPPQVLGASPAGGAGQSGRRPVQPVARLHHRVSGLHHRRARQAVAPPHLALRGDGRLAVAALAGRGHAVLDAVRVGTEQYGGQHHREREAERGRPLPASYDVLRAATGQEPAVGDAGRPPQEQQDLVQRLGGGGGEVEQQGRAEHGDGGQSPLAQQQVTDAEQRGVAEGHRPRVGGGRGPRRLGGLRRQGRTGFVRRICHEAPSSSGRS
ncbi:hypothetical protein SVIOM74S_04639 [Streptomyces violarus]